MDEPTPKSWFAINGKLQQIAFDGPTHFRFPEEVAERVVTHYSKKADWVLDPFAGFGTTLRVAQKLGRQAIGLEIDARRAVFANRGLAPPNLVINGSAKSALTLCDGYLFELLFTSPPYIPPFLKDDPWGATYFQDMRDIFSDLKPLLAVGAKVVIEVCNIRRGNTCRPLAWQMAALLADIYEFKGEVVRCNTSEVEAGPGFNHSYLLVFENNGTKNVTHSNRWSNPWAI